MGLSDKMFNFPPSYTHGHNILQYVAMSQMWENTASVMSWLLIFLKGRINCCDQIY